METPKDKVEDLKVTTDVELLSIDMEAVKLNDRSCRFAMSEPKTKALKTPLKKVKSRHPTDPLPTESGPGARRSSEKKLSLSTSDSYLANKNLSSTSSEKINRRKSGSVSGSNVNIPVAFPSACSSGTLDDNLKSMGTPTKSSDNELVPRPNSASGRGSRGQRTPKKEAPKGFESYMMLDQVQQGLKKGELIEGVLRINPKNYQDAYISVPGGQMDICLGGIVDRNRALNGDVVVVSLKPKEEWRILLSDLRNYLLRNNLVAINYLTPKLLSSPRKRISPLKPTTSNTNTLIEKRRTESVDKASKGNLESPNLSEIKRKKSIPKGGKDKKRKVLFGENEIENTKFDTTFVDSKTLPVNVKKGKKTRRSRKNNKRATTDLDAQDTQVPSVLINDDNCTYDDKSLLDVKAENGKEKFEFNQDSLSSSLANFNFSDITANEGQSMHFSEKGEQNIGLPCHSTEARDANAKLFKTESAEYLDDIYYPENLETKDAENAAIECVEDDFNWSELLTRIPLEKLRVSDLINIPSAKNFLQITAKVVYIVRRSHNLMARGHLKPLADKNSKYALFRPIDHRFPLVNIPISNCPAGFFDSPDSFKETLFIAKMTEWAKPAFALGIICSSVNGDSDVASETAALLLESGVETDEFPATILNDLPFTLPFSISPRDTIDRRDYRASCVFTIDPITARDLDDAISCDRADENGLFKVAVHIADVSHFVIPGSEIDLKASRRSTSVYLPTEVIPMLPRALCEELCSLRPTEDRLTFSVEWVIRESDGAILSEWFGKSVIRSCAQLSYEHAQSMIDGVKNESLPDVNICAPWSHELINDRIQTLYSISKKLREKRISRGALRLDQLKLNFHLDDDGLPDELVTYKQRESNRLIEELMILANIAVARKIYTTYPHMAVLRNHPQPVKRALDEVIDALRPYGIHLDSSSSKTLQASLNNYTGVDDVSFARHQLITHLLTKPMKLANYFCSGAMSNELQFVHYALSVPLYTHFTSPIRRYPDILVHRLLNSALNNANLPAESSKILLLQQQLSHCNHAKATAKTISDKCNEVNLVAYVRKLGSFETDAIVCGVMDQSFDVLLYNMAIVKRVYCDQINTLDKVELEDEPGGCRKLKLIFSDGVFRVITLFTVVKIMLMISENDNKKLVACLQCVL